MISTSTPFGGFNYSADHGEGVHGVSYCSGVRRTKRNVREADDEAFCKEAWSLKDFIKLNRIAVLNVAGPRESNQPGVYAFALKMLRKYWENP